MSPLAQYALKVVVSALVIVAVSEIAKRSSAFAALIASLPLTSVLAFIWLHLDGAPPARIAQLATDIVWLTLPSFALFIALPLMLRHGYAFWTSLCASAVLTVGCYFALLPLLRRMGVQL